MTKAFLKILLPLLLAAWPAAAQYSRPTGLGEQKTTAKERVMQAYEDARWQLGPLQLEPRLSISDIGYISNIYSTAENEAESDLRATASAGLRGFINFGPKVLVSPFVDLSHSWWLEQEDLRSTNESFGVQIFGDLNRVQLQLQAGQIGTQRKLSSELEVPVDLDNERLELGFEIDFWGPLRMFGTAAKSRLRYSGAAAEAQISNLDLALLAADGELLRGGLDYEFGDTLRLGVGLEWSETTFPADPSGRSNRGSGPLIRIGFEGSRLTADIDVARRDVEFVGRAVGKRRQTRGLLQLRWKFTEKLSAGLYGDVRLQPSALDRNAVFESQRTGFSLQRNPGTRTRLSAFYEIGEDEFATVASDQVTRIDDFRSYGLTLQRQLTPRLAVNLGYVDSQRESTDPEFDRSFRSLVSSVSLGGDLLPW